MQLAFAPKQPMLVIMEKSWFAKMFSSSKTSTPAAASSDADNADPEAQFNRGLRFATGGAGNAQDYVQAAAWYRKAAEQHHGLAQFNLGIMYAQGQGVDRDDVQSDAWFDRAARLGDAGGQFRMGQHFERASLNGLPADAPEARIEAYKWYQLAAAQGYKGSDGAHAVLTFRMTREDVAEATERVARFVAAKPTVT
jgi:TPR repeat protein